MTIGVISGQSVAGRSRSPQTWTSRHQTSPPSLPKPSSNAISTRSRPRTERAATGESGRSCQSQIGNGFGRPDITSMAPRTPNVTVSPRPRSSGLNLKHSGPNERNNHGSAAYDDHHTILNTCPLPSRCLTRSHRGGPRAWRLAPAGPSRGWEQTPQEQEQRQGQDQEPQKASADGESTGPKHSYGAPIGDQDVHQHGAHRHTQ